MTNLQKIELPIGGMDCHECTEHVQHAIAALPGVASVSVLLASEKALITLDPARVDLPMLRSAVAGAGYSVKDESRGMKDETKTNVPFFILNRNRLTHP